MKNLVEPLNFVSNFDNFNLLSTSNNDTMINSEESEDSLSKYIQEEEKEGLIINDFGDKIIPMDLSIINKPTKKNSSKKKNQRK